MHLLELEETSTSDVIAPRRLVGVYRMDVGDETFMTNHIFNVYNDGTWVWGQAAHRLTWVAEQHRQRLNVGWGYVFSFSDGSTGSVAVRDILTALESCGATLLA